MGALADKIRGHLEAEFGAPEDSTAEDRFCSAIEAAIIEWLTAHVVASPGIPVATAGGPAAQTGSTTAPGTLEVV